MTNAGRVLMIPKGEYNSATTYEMLDFVYYQGRSYVCKQTSTGNAPTNTTYWQALTGADADKMDATNPTGTGSFSLNRKANTTIGSNSFAEGSNTTASGEASHAEGQNTTASGNYSHAEGTTNVASGYGSHAEGLGVTASGVGCHAEGNYTIAGYQFQHVCGKNNDNKATTLFEVGNGADPEADRSNAFEVYSDGTLSTDNGTTKVKLETLVSQNQALTNYVADTGVKNLLPLSLAHIKAKNTTGTWNDNAYTQSGVTFTVNTDSNGNVTSITSSGIPSALVDFRILEGITSIGAGTYTLNGCPSGGNVNTYYILTQTDGIWGTVVDTGSGTTATLTTGLTGLVLRVRANVDVTGKTWKPMLRDASITDPTYQPYAMTNKELTDAQTKKVEISSEISLDDCVDEHTIYYIKNAYVPINAPEADAYNSIIWVKDAGSYIIQFYTSSNKKAIYFRFKAGTAWQPWQKVTSTQL